MNNCTNIQALLIDFVDKKLDKGNTLAVSKHLQNCKSCREEADSLVILFDEMNRVENELPDDTLRMNFEELLETEKAKGKSTFLMPLKNKNRFMFFTSQIAAAIAILISGIFIGSQFGKAGNPQNEVAELRSEVNTMKEMLILSKLEQPVASERIVAASYLDGNTAPNVEVLKALIQTMNTDRNSNVRMAAVNALEKFKQVPLVSNAFVESLDIQTDPIIQISLINILVKLHDTRAIDKMKQIIDNNSTNESVKKLAEQGIVTLI